MDKKTGRWLRIGFGLSLALNLMGVGLVAGMLWRHGGAPRYVNTVQYAVPYLRALPFEARRDVMRTLRQSGADLHSMRIEGRALYAEMDSALRAQPFDPAAVEAILARQAALGQQVQTQSQSIWLARVMAMDDLARAAYADAVADVLRRPRGKPPRGNDRATAPAE